MAFDVLGDDKAQGSSTSALSLPPGHSRNLVANNYMSAINAALRHVAARDGLALVDFEALAMQVGMCTRWCHCQSALALVALPDLMCAVEICRPQVAALIDTGADMSTPLPCSFRQRTC